MRYVPPKPIINKRESVARLIMVLGDLRLNKAMFPSGVNVAGRTAAYWFARSEANHYCNRVRGGR